MNKQTTIGILAVILVILLFIWARENSKEWYSRDPILDRLKRDAMPIAPDVIKKIKLYEGSRAYTLNKERIYLCLRKQDGTYYSYNTLMYVFLHELSHAIYKGDSSDHNESYQQLFDQILDKAQKLGIFNPNETVEDAYCAL